MLISSSFILGTSDVQFRGDIVRTNKILDTLRGQKVKGKVTNCRGWGGGCYMTYSAVRGPSFANAHTKLKAQTGLTS